MKSSLEFLLYAGLLLFSADVRGLITENPLNAVAEVGQQAIFNCTSDTTLQNWVFSAKRDDVGTPSAQIIVLNCVVQPGFTTHYEVDRPGGSNNKCSLIVKATTLQQAGVYTCTDAAPGLSAILTVIDSSPVITVNNTNDERIIVENQSVIIECVVNHNGSVAPAPTLWPYFYWTNSTGQTVSSSYDLTTANTAVSKKTVTAGRQNITEYTCHVYLQLMPPTTPNYDSTTPNVSSSASSPVIEVLYSPQISNISSEGRNDSTITCEISTITCHATANPTANYTWIDIEEPSKIIYNQSYGRAEFGRNYNCSATNIIKTIAYTDVKTHEERDEYSSRPPCKGCRMSTVNITGETCTDRRCSCLFDCNMTVICSAEAYPEPKYQWMQNDQVIRDNTGILDAVPDGIYSCVARNVIDGYEFKASIDIEVVNCSARCGYTPYPIWSEATTVEMTTTESPDNKTTPASENDDDWMIIVGVVLVYEMANLISMGFFLAYYNIDSDRNTNENNRNVATNKRALNKRFPWLERMLPCMNQSHASAGKKCLWIFVFSLITISCGVFIFPILIIIVKCCGTDLHGSQENSQLNLKLDDMSGSARGGNRFPPPPSSLPPAPRLPSTSAAGLQRPIPPPNKPTRPPPPAMTHQMNREGGAAEYAFLPLARRPHLAPAQYLDDDETSHYAILRRV